MFLKLFFYKLFQKVPSFFTVLSNHKTDIKVNITHFCFYFNPISWELLRKVQKRMQNHCWPFDIHNILISKDDYSDL